MVTAKLHILYGCRPGIGHYPSCASITISHSKTAIEGHLNFISVLPCCFSGGLSFLVCFFFLLLFSRPLRFEQQLLLLVCGVHLAARVFLLCCVSIGVGVEQCPIASFGRCVPHFFFVHRLKNNYCSGSHFHVVPQ